MIFVLREGGNAVTLKCKRFLYICILFVSSFSNMCSWKRTEGLIKLNVCLHDTLNKAYAKSARRAETIFLSVESPNSTACKLKSECFDFLLLIGSQQI